MASSYYGSRGSGVREMQERLNRMGAGLKEDGIWGDKTEAAYNKLMGSANLGKQGPSPEDMFARIDYKAPTDDDLADKARKAVSGEYDAMEAGEKQKADRIIKSLQEAINGLDPKYAGRLDLLDGYYADARQDISNQAVKRGMGRSSLYLETLTKNHNDLLAAKQQTNAEYQNELAGFNSDIRAAEMELETNLGSISARRESEIRKYMDDLASQRDKTMVEMIKYNNDIAQKEYEYYAGLLEKLETDVAVAAGGGSSGGRKSGGRRRSGRSSGRGSSSSGNGNTNTTAMSGWNNMSAAQKVTYFNTHGASIRLSNTKAYNQMKAEVDSIKKGGYNKYGVTNMGYTSGNNGKVYSTGR